ncbi:retrotransposon protein, putative, ty1-copia subclass, partial [Tanacetum coccineum]
AKASKERLDIVKSLMACKLKLGASICAFVLEMKGYFNRLEHLNLVFDAELSINIILSALVLTVGHNAKKRKTSHSNWKEKATKGKSNRWYKRKAESEIVPTSDPKEAVYFYYNTKGHWKRSCPKYLKDLKDKKVEKGSHSGSKGKYEDGYKFSFDNENGDILVYSNGCFMFKASSCKGIYEVVKCISHNGNVILNVGSSNELDKLKLWHSHLGHINKKRIAQLQKDRVLKSFDFKSDDVSESCLLGKMTKLPFTGSCERGKGLLDLVHIDVCGPFRSTRKDGNRYYVSKRGRESTGQNDKVAHILNLVPTKKVSKTPFEMWKGKRPSLGHIKIWV